MMKTLSRCAVLASALALGLALPVLAQMEMSPATQQPEQVQSAPTPEPAPEAVTDGDEAPLLDEFGNPVETGEEAADAELVVNRWRQYATAQLRGLDKITGRSTDIEMRIGEPVIFGSLRVELQVCFQTPPDFPPESASFLRIHSLKPMGEAAGLDPEPLIFSGWMFASSPGLNALEHPVYDLWVIECDTGEGPVDVQR